MSVTRRSSNQRQLKLLWYRSTRFLLAFACYAYVVTATDNWYCFKWSDQNFWASYKDPLSIVHHCVIAVLLSGIVALLDRDNVRVVATVLVFTFLGAQIGVVIGSITFSNEVDQVVVFFALLGTALGFLKSHRDKPFAKF